MPLHFKGCAVNYPTFTSFDDLVAKATRQLGALLEQRPVVSVEVDGGQTSDEPGAGPDVAGEVWRTGAGRQTTHVQLIADVEVNRTSPVAAASPRDVIAHVIVVVGDVRRRSVVDAKHLL